MLTLYQILVIAIMNYRITGACIKVLPEGIRQALAQQCRTDHGGDVSRHCSVDVGTEWT